MSQLNVSESPQTLASPLRPKTKEAIAPYTAKKPPESKITTKQLAFKQDRSAQRKSMMTNNLQTMT